MTGMRAGTYKSVGRRSHLSVAAVGVVVAIAVGLLLTAAQARAATTVSKSQREAVIFVADLRQGDDIERAIFSFINFAAVNVTRGFIDDDYNVVRVRSGSNATRAGLKDALKDSAKKSKIKAVDLFFSVHGLTGRVLIDGKRVKASTLEADIKDHLTNAQRAKLRMVYSTACFGRSHGKSWRDAGFEATSGSERIYADAALSHPAFLGSWTLGSTSFRQAVNNANAVGPPADAAAKAFFRARGRDGLADEVNSQRFVRGAGNQVRLNRMP